MRALSFALTLTFLVIAPVSGATAAAKGEPRNKLAGEPSPYLRQHADDPVDWYPWGPEAFAKAKAENKPVFVSVGYASCHWCHVMERESFEDNEVAAYLNKHFISIKVDRERRPTLDDTLMLVTEMITRGGGWPNNVFLTPDGKPFYGGVYFPKAGFLDILGQITNVWAERPADIKSEGARIAGILDSYQNRKSAAVYLTEKTLRESGTQILSVLDVFNGGFGKSPKFPQEPALRLLADQAWRSGDARARTAFLLSIDALIDGGIHDQLGGGFHRYTVDEHWRVPHFEKMLYNQAQIADLLVDAYRMSGKKRYADALRKTLDAVLSDFTSPDGTFYAAFDADTDGVEGLYYMWTPKQLAEALGDDDAKRAAKLFGVTKEGHLDGKSVLHVPNSAETADTVAARQAFVARLQKARERRPRPARDNKILVAWNGLMIRAFARAGLHLAEPRYTTVAARAAEKLFARHWNPKTGEVFRAHFDGKLTNDGVLRDYAALILAGLALADGKDGGKWMKRAEAVGRAMLKRFTDPEAGDLFAQQAASAFMRSKSRSDNELPSASALALEALSGLAASLREPLFERARNAISDGNLGLALKSPLSHAGLIRASAVATFGPLDPVQTAARGTVRIKAGLDTANSRLTIDLNIADGWHINSRKPLQDYLKPTVLTVTGAKNAKIAYPKSVTKRLQFNDKPLSLYEGDVRLTAPVDLERMRRTGRLSASLQLQSCSDTLCMEPMRIELRLGPGDGRE